MLGSLEEEKEEEEEELVNSFLLDLSDQKLLVQAINGLGFNNFIKRDVLIPIVIFGVKKPH